MPRPLALALLAAPFLNAIGCPDPCLAQAPADPAPARAAIAKLDRLVGDWEGEATLVLGPGRSVGVHQTERVRKKLDGVALVIEGLGVVKPGTKEEKVVFQALAIAVPAPAVRGYKIHAFRDNGMSVVADAEVTEKGMIWGFEDGRGGKTRYTITVEGDAWTEVGEHLREGAPPRKFFEMKVKRKPQADRPNGR